MHLPAFWSNNTCKWPHIIATGTFLHYLLSTSRRSDPAPEQYGFVFQTKDVTFHHIDMKCFQFSRTQNHMWEQTVKQNSLWSFFLKEYMKRKDESEVEKTYQQSSLVFSHLRAMPCVSSVSKPQGRAEDTVPSSWGHFEGSLHGMDVGCCSWLQFEQQRQVQEESRCK